MRWGVESICTQLT
ncbi:transposase, partial [Mycobacterium tuberculosis KT-0085]